MSLWERVTFGTVRRLIWCGMRFLSPRHVYRIGQAFGTLEWLVNYKRRRRFRRQYDRLFGHENVAGARPALSRRRATREYFVRTRCDKIFYLIIDRLSPEQIGHHFQVGNQRLLDEALARGRGVFVALSHHGAHHVAGLLLALSGYRVAGVRHRQQGGAYRFLRHKLADRFPGGEPVRMLFADTFPRDIYRCFQENYTLGALPDVGRVRGAHQRTETVQLFGQPADLVTGTLRIAMRCGATILQGFVLARSGFRYRLELSGPLVDPETSETPETIRSALQTYAQNIERVVRADPAMVSRV